MPALPVRGDNAQTVIAQSLSRGQFAAALETAEAEIRVNPKDARLWTLRAMALGRLNRRDKSLESFHHALQLQPKYLPALQGAAELEYQLKHPRARTTLERILGIDPSNKVAHAMVAVLAFEAGDCSAAATHFEQASELTARQKAASWQFGVCLFRLGRMPGAAKAFRQALTRDEGDSRVRMNLALALAGAEQTREAIEALLPLSNGTKPDADVLGMLGELYRASGKLTEAIAAYRRGIALYPGEERLYMGLVALCAHYNSFDLGFEILEVGLRNLPESSRLYAMRGFLHHLAGHNQESFDDFARASEAAPSDTVGQAGRALTLLNAGRTEESIGVLRDELAHDTPAVNIRYLLAQALLRKGGDAELAEAQQLLETCSHSDPRFAPARALLGKVYIQQGKHDAAIPELESALALAPDNRIAVYQLMRAYNLAGRSEDARRMNDRIRDLLEKDRREEAEKGRFRLLKMPE